MKSNLARALVLIAIGSLILLGGCARFPQTGVTALKPATLADLRSHLLTKQADVDAFRLRGPFAVTVKEDLELQIGAAERYEIDAYLASPVEMAPLVILVHGHENSKDDHAYQGWHLASWGMHSIAVQLPNTGPWVRNGEILARIVRFIQQRPEAIDRRVDPKRIVIAGHSFGSVSAAVALAAGAPALGAVFLDPARSDRSVPAYLRKVRSPVMVLAADGNVGMTRNRGDFYRYIHSDVAEISVTGAQHDDATFPLEASFWDSDASFTEEHQITFVAALTATAFSLAFTGKLDYAWASFAAEVRAGKLFDPMRK